MLFLDSLFITPTGRIRKELRACVFLIRTDVFKSVQITYRLTRKNKGVIRRESPRAFPNFCYNPMQLVSQKRELRRPSVVNLAPTPFLVLVAIPINIE
jgi:hypothetical protein